MSALSWVTREQGGHDDTGVGWLEERKRAERDWKMHLLRNV